MTRWLDTIEDEARSVLPAPVWRYFAAGAREGVTRDEAVAAWREHRVAPRVLRDVSRVDTTTTLLGTAYAAPVGIAPTSMQRAAHPEGERAVLAGAAGFPVVVSSNCGFPFAELDARDWWLQVYLPPDRGSMVPLLRAAVGAGASALVLTVDTPAPGTKYDVDDQDWADLDLSWHRCNLPASDGPFWADDLTPADIRWLGEVSGLPVVVKGVLRGDDARAAVEAGAAAVWVSNHGGRQLDRAVATAHALPEVVAALPPEVEVYVDGGVRSGLDVLLALSLGARAVFVGRPALHALTVSGAAGVRRLLRDLEAELVESLRLSGCSTPAEARSLGVLRRRSEP